MEVKLKFRFNYTSWTHPKFNQTGNINWNDMILAMFCPLQLVNWEINHPYSMIVTSSHYFFQIAKEAYNHHIFLEIFNDDILHLKSEGFNLIINGQRVNKY